MAHNAKAPRDVRYVIEGREQTIPDDPSIKRVPLKADSTEAQYVRKDGTFRIGDWIDDFTED